MEEEHTPSSGTVRFTTPTRSEVRVEAIRKSSNRAKNLQSLRKLQQSNFILERILSEQKQKEMQLESNCKLLEETLRRTKSQKLKTTVRNLSGNLFLLFACLLLWGNWIMFSPHLDPIVMACLVSVLVSDLQQALVHFFDYNAASAWRVTKHHLLIAILAACGVFVPIIFSNPSAMHLLFLLLPILLLSRFASPRTKTALILTMGVLIICFLPLALVFKACVEELDTAKLVIFNTMLQEEDDLIAVRINAVLLRSGYGKIDPKQIAQLKLWIKTNLFDVLVNSQSALGVVSNFSNILWSFGTFAATLFSLLQLDLGEMKKHLLAFSPLGAEDNWEIYSTVKTSTYEVVLRSASVGLVNGLLTYVSLWAVESPLLALPAFAASVLAVVPFFGSYIALLPFVLGFYLAQMEMQALFIAAVHAVTLAVINPILLSLTSQQQGGSRFLGGLPVVAGLYAFGLGGIVFGPLLVGLGALTAKIYARALHGGTNNSSSEDEAEEEAEVRDLFARTPVLG